MNMKSLSKADLLKDKFKSLLIEKTEEDGIEHDAFMLMAGYLSEIERIKEESKTPFTRKDLAAKIKTTASYLTQVFRGNKPLNFYTLAKIQRALNIRFEVKAKPVTKHFLTGSTDKDIAPVISLSDYNKFKKTTVVAINILDPQLSDSNKKVNFS